MKLNKIVIGVGIAVLLMTAAAFAASNPTTGSNNMIAGQCQTFDSTQEKDPLKALENRKAKIEKDVADGKITREEADKKIVKINERIKAINEFNSLTVQQKKEKLVGDFKTKMDKKVTDGKLTREKADEMIFKFNEKVEKWDGNGYPKFMFTGEKGCHKKDGKHQKNHQSPE